MFFIFLFLNGRAQSVPVFTISVQSNPAGCSKGNAKLSIQGGSGPLTVSWSNGHVGSMVYGLDAGTYQVTVQDTLLQDTMLNVVIDSLVCAIQPKLAFSPNGDGINDTWDISNVTLYDQFLIQVYTRWGQKVLECKSDYIPWDGTSLGFPVPDGTYYYIIEFDDKYYGKQTRHGSITLLR